MASSSSSTRLIVIAVLVSFVGGCWIGMGSDDPGDAFCVVTTATAAQHPGAAPGQLTDQPETGCLPGEPQVCGRFEGEADEQRFVSDECGD
jgi:hypothetical protein